VPGRGARRGKTRGRITGRVTALVVLLLALLVVGGAAAGTERSLPWSGGTSRTTPIERALSGVAARLAGNERTVRCASPGQWRALGAQHDFGAAVTWAMTPLLGAPGSATRPEGYSSLAPRTCRLLAAFAAAPVERGTRICRHGASRGAPVLGECDGWGATLVAVHVLGHESIHLAGVVDEAAADCLAMQVDALVAMQLGATRVFARTLARDYWEQYYAAQEPEYRSPQCRDAGSLDLFRADGGWPTPRRYPPRIGEALESFGTRPVDH
jgi:hypothetical protein